MHTTELSQLHQKLEALRPLQPTELSQLAETEVVHLSKSQFDELRHFITGLTLYEARKNEPTITFEQFVKKHTA